MHSITTVKRVPRYWRGHLTEVCQQRKQLTTLDSLGNSIRGCESTPEVLGSISTTRIWPTASICLLNKDVFPESQRDIQENYFYRDTNDKGDNWEGYLRRQFL